MVASRMNPVSVLLELLDVMQSFSEGFHDQTDQCISNDIRR